MSLTIAGLEVEVVRKKIKNLYLRVLPPDGRIRVSAPMRTPNAAIEQFVRSKLDWIAKQRALLAEREIMPPQELEMLREQFAADVAQLLPKWEAITGLYSSGYQIKLMKSRWGSCNVKTRKICLNLRLAERPRECLEYVILHELAHLRARGHGADFWALVAKYMPDHKQRRARLNGR